MIQRNASLCIMLLLLANLLLAQRKQQSPASPADRTAISGEAYQSFTPDGAWCWFSDPRAVYYEGEYKRTYAGWIDSYGNVVIGAYDHETRQIETTIVAERFEVDDHDNPSILIDKQGYILCFYAKHSERQGIRMRRSLGPEQISAWEEERIVGKNGKAITGRFGDRYTYANVAYLSDEDRMYLFWRSSDGKPTYSYSNDGGNTWTIGKVFFMPDPIYRFRRPYVKVSSNGKDKIGFTLTDGHPRKEKTNSVYFTFLKGGNFYRADGTRIKSLMDGPLTPADLDKVYEATEETGKAWVWDIAFDKQDRPVIAYVRFPDDSQHIYRYGRWDGKQWHSYDLIHSGSWFPQTPAGKTEPEPNYSGGLVIDHEDVNTLYVSVKRDSVFEIEKWTTVDEGETWRHQAITQGSSKDNIRPFTVRNAGPGNPLQVLWVVNNFYEHYTKYQSAIQTGIPFDRAGVNPLSPTGIMDLCGQVADWQILNPVARNRGYRDFRQQGIDWIYGAFHTGLWAYYQKSGEAVFKEHIKNIGYNHDWRPYPGIFNADNHTFFQQAIELYQEEPRAEYIDDIRYVMDIHLARDPSAPENLYHNRKDNPYHHEWWTWCDALYMSPPAFARMYHVTGAQKYLDYAIKYWKKTADFLYSPADSLYYRDYNYFDKLTENGRKIFWSRGNGWVFAGLARFIPYIPEDHPERAYFVEQFKAMATKLIQLQDETDGMWRVSLLDPDYLNQGESSGTAFFTWGLLWGINAGVLEEPIYRPAAEKGWKALCRLVNEDGRLGYVQQVAASPYPFYAHQYHLYASGAFLGAGMEMIDLLQHRP